MKKKKLGGARALTSKRRLSLSFLAPLAIRPHTHKHTMPAFAFLVGRKLGLHRSKVREGKGEGGEMERGGGRSLSLPRGFASSNRPAVPPLFLPPQFDAALPSPPTTPPAEAIPA